MRITIPVAISGECWAPTVPEINLAVCFPTNAQGEEEFDASAFRSEIRNCERIQIASDDSDSVLAFAAMLLSAVNDWVKANDRNDGSRKMCRVSTRLAKHNENGRVNPVRITLTNAITPFNGRTFMTVRVKITHDAKSAIGYPFERDFALFLADMCKGFSRRFEEHDSPPLVFTPETQALIEETHERTLISKTEQSNEWRLLCSHHRNGYCAPLCTDCPHYHNGRCEIVRHVFVDADVAASVPLSAEAERIEAIVKGEHVK